MPQWNLDELRHLIRRHFGSVQLELARQSISSVVQRQEYGRFHYHEAIDLLNSDIERMHKEDVLVLAALGADQEHWDAFNECLFKIGAHVTACIQSMHSIADTLAHAIYFSLGLNLDPDAIEEHRITVHSLASSLSTREGLIPLGRALTALKSHPDFQYLTALVNHGKHRSLIRPSIWFDATGQKEEPYELRFQDCTYNSVTYPGVKIQDFLSREFHRLSRIVVDTGIQLNDTLRSNTAP